MLCLECRSWVGVEAVDWEPSPLQWVCRGVSGVFLVRTHVIQSLSKSCDTERPRGFVSAGDQHFGWAGIVLLSFMQVPDTFGSMG